MQTTAASNEKRRNKPKGEKQQNVMKIEIENCNFNAISNKNNQSIATDFLGFSFNFPSFCSMNAAVCVTENNIYDPVYWHYTIQLGIRLDNRVPIHTRSRNDEPTSKSCVLCTLYIEYCMQLKVNV